MFPFKGLYWKKFPKPLVLLSRLFGKLKKFPNEGLFPFYRFPVYHYELYLHFQMAAVQGLTGIGMVKKNKIH